MVSTTLEQAYFVAEIIGVVVVAISIIFLAIEMRQNTKAVKLSTLHDVKETIREVNLAWAQDSDLSEIMYQGFRDVNNLDGASRVRYYTTMHNLFLGYENLFYQRDAGALDTKHWSGMSQHIVDALSVPGIRGYWEARKHWFTADFQNFIDNDVIPTPPHPSYEHVAT